MSERVLALPQTSDVEWWWVQGRSPDVPAELAREQFNAWLNGIRAAVWDEGFDACANWWEIHHHGLKRDDTNPYRPEATS